MKAKRPQGAVPLFAKIAFDSLGGYNRNTTVASGATWYPLGISSVALSFSADEPFLNVSDSTVTAIQYTGKQRRTFYARGMVHWSNSASKNLDFAIWKDNGTTLSYGDVARSEDGDSIICSTCTTTLYLNENDTVYIGVRNNDTAEDPYVYWLDIVLQELNV